MLTRQKLNRILNQQSMLQRELSDLMPSQHERSKYYTEVVGAGILSDRIRPPLVAPDRQKRIDSLNIRLERMNEFILKNWSKINSF